MSVIYSFLQKRKMHESQHGYILIFIAYILSAFLLLLGSDMFYNINSSAAGVSTDTYEEAQGLLSKGVYHSNSDVYTTQLTATGIINPYDLDDTTVKETNGTAESVSTSGDTVWLFGNAMDGKAFDKLMQQIGTLKTAAHREKAAAKSRSVKKTISRKYSHITDKDVKMLERIVQAEAGGEDMKGKILVANVIMNRVENEHFPDSVEKVIFQKQNGNYQFSPVKNQRYWSVKISDETKEAVKRALEGEDYSKGALYFVARRKTTVYKMEWFDKKLDWLFKHGGHEFYKNR